MNAILVAFALPLQYYVTLFLLHILLPTKFLSFSPTNLQLLKTFTAVTCTVLLRHFTAIPFPPFPPLPSPLLLQQLNNPPLCLLTFLPYIGQIAYYCSAYLLSSTKKTKNSHFFQLFSTQLLLLFFKNCVLASFIEEYIYRHVLFYSRLDSTPQSFRLPLSHSASSFYFHFISCALLFGLAHLHHILDHFLFAVGFIEWRSILLLASKSLSFISSLFYYLA